MDGYAVIAAEAVPGATFHVIGEAAAGARHAGKVGPGVGTGMGRAVGAGMALCTYHRTAFVPLGVHQPKCVPGLFHGRACLLLQLGEPFDDEALEPLRRQHKLRAM